HRIESDHNIDNSTAILREWLSAVSHLYHQVEVNINNTKEGYPDETSPCEWTETRFSNVIRLREKALNYARNIWADYLFMIDADVTLENERTLQLLIEQNKFIVAPMLNSSVSGYYSNFWGGMSDKGYYIRTSFYLPIVEREIKGIFSVPMVHSAFLVDLNHRMSPLLSYSQLPDYTGPKDDIIIFANNVKLLGETMHILNTEYFGKVMMPLDKRFTLADESAQFDYVKLEAMVEEVPPLYSSPHVYIPERPKDKLGFDQIYMINLKRRPARRFRMLKAFDYLGIEAKVIDAVDGKELNDTYLNKLGVQMLPGFADPYHGRAMTMGEIGCFLSHYFIWKEAIDKNYQKILIFEDDVRFEAYFRTKLANMMYELESTFKVWDLVDGWKLQFSPRDLIGLSAEPFLVYPTHYTGEPNYFSDTEDSVVIDKEPDQKTARPVGEEQQDVQEEDLSKMESQLKLEVPTFREEL
uniref:Glycosyl transferase family 25 domain-containing protein n=1 Tax=Biomphalaria glabrata TaxID=6526 RepID=A0A2C9KWA3_BIOGL